MAAHKAAAGSSVSTETLPQTSSKVKNSIAGTENILQETEERAAAQKAEKSGKTRSSIAGTETIIDEALKNANEKYGSIEKGENPARDIKVPRKSSDDQRVSYTIRTALEAGVTPDVLVPKIAQGVISGGFSD